ncbi:M20/M25/M40 family metallo-hydrolase [Alkalicoccobacillus porphyridii]|nr:M20/M25/M40 family metallo-hydrolase [Alkalicoccobacillus porphyridii]
MGQKTFLQYEHADRVKQLTLELVNQPSISGTKGECEMVDTIVTILQRMDYYKSHAHHIKRVPIKGDPLQREAIVARMEGDPDSKRGVLLLSHFDVVGVDDFGQYKSYAFTPAQLEGELKRENEGFLDAHAQQDLYSNDYLFGRGTMDMKAGLAMQLSVLQDISETPGNKQNLILVAVPDEEMLSKGMFAAVGELHDMREAGWSFDACICSEPNFSSYPNDHRKYIYTGSTGKLLPFIYCLGRETHVGQPLEGINASVMAAQIAVEMEWSEVFADQAMGEKSPSPTCLRIRDIKESYDVQTPNEAYLLYNVLTLATSPDGVIHKVTQACETASERIYQRLVSLRSAQTHVPNGLISEPPKPRVYTLEHLYKLGIDKYGQTFQGVYQDVIRAVDIEEEDYSEKTLAIARRLSGYFLDLAPFYLVLLQPPYYPHVHLDKDTDRALLSVVRQVTQYALEQCGEEVAEKTFFPGLSDVSYCRSSGNQKTIESLEKHMPLFGYDYHVPLKEIANIDIPTMNIGPFGKDAHKRTERLQLSYSTETAPLLLTLALQKIHELHSV